MSRNPETEPTMPTDQTGPQAPDYDAPETAPIPADDKPRKTSGISAGIWVALILGALILVLLLVFIIQNNMLAQFHYFGWDFELPLGAAMLLAAIAGILIAGIAGSVRIFLLSRRLRKTNKALADVKRALGR